MIGAAIILHARSTGASAQSGTIRIIVGTAPGGAIEPYARMIADHMAKTLGQTIIIENKPGASGALAAQYIADAPADGTILWLGTQAFTEIMPNMFPNTRWSIDQFHPIIRGVEAPLVLRRPSERAGQQFRRVSEMGEGEQGQAQLFAPISPARRRISSVSSSTRSSISISPTCPIAAPACRPPRCSPATRCSALPR